MIINNTQIDKISVRRGETLINITLRVDEEMFQVLKNFTKEYNLNSVEETILSILEDELFEHDVDNNKDNIIYEENNNVEIL